MFLICDDLERTIADLRKKGVEFSGEVTEEDWGLLAMMVVPGHGEVGLYQPAHPSPLDGVGT